MSLGVSVHLLPTAFEPAELRGTNAVMIDLLRASTTIVHALAAGATAVLPCETVDEARAAAANLPAGAAVLGGERHGVLIEGFDLDNSPLGYTKENVARKTVVFTTTNGTRGLLRCREAKRVFIGAYVNSGALVKMLAKDSSPVHLVCAGTNGNVSFEDVLCAGAVVMALIAANPKIQTINDEAILAMDLFSLHSRSESAFREAMRTGLGGSGLVGLGLAADIDRAAQRDLFDIVPEYFAGAGRITIARPGGG